MLTKNQKRIIIDYMLTDYSKGIFEDLPEFWEGIPEDQMDEKYSELQRPVGEFVQELNKVCMEYLDKTT